MEIACQQGDKLQENWKDVVQCISQLEKLQAYANTSIEEIRRSSLESKNAPKKDPKIELMAAEASSQSMALLVDKIFTSSVKLSGSAIVFFVTALCEQSLEEITTSADKEHPRMYCLQRLVEISYFNMKRIKIEWSNIWSILGEHFNQISSHPNTNIGFFALDKLRQLSMKFL